ncbi:MULTISPECIES: roadblock/LC7 domain-containing protein [unclassified Alcanivorax]|jgi:predicted regulator of Ras-like GTPase activity (Roadblock/LC7/MglB family)|uniref:roadblock/LC7 domain-containing protein n=1 Tax=unclassified Alcanivorax TaxID=2638842 RepID=UPI000789DB00|nr:MULTISPECIES: roadblock/LC7 domain-containing protein [unclassified Alcanivorax]MEE2602462.1 roadblock/LC7 domain-containing protein [Pseudomonadota bacterium]MEE3388624.1 roadblock/LC7 domain-containing protein [Pseudomonadota bacterium]SEF38934.1 Roadblock/LC7 domain-containing protein [Alcanivorax sp. DSM 26293]
MTNKNPLGQAATEIAQQQLQKLRATTTGITSAVLLSSDGFEVTSLETDKGKASRLAAMGSSLAAISSAIAKEAGISECRRLIVESEEGVVAVMTVPDSSPPLVLAVVANDASRLGQLLWGAKHCCAALSKKLKK